MSTWPLWGPSPLVVGRRDEACFESDGLRTDSSYRNLGPGAASDGRVGVSVNRATGPLEHETGWHWHDLTLHLVYVIRGSLTFRFRGVEEPVALQAGDVISQPPGVPHNVVARSEDLEVLEITMPAEYGTFEL